MRILHVVKRSLVRHTPARIACYWGRYTEHTSLGICTSRRGGYGCQKSPLNSQGWFFADGRGGELEAEVSRADVVHCHDDGYPTLLPQFRAAKRLIYQAHIGDIPKRLFKSGRYRYHRGVKHACITNGYGRFFDREEKRSGVSWGRLPDILDLDHPVYRPDPELRAKNKKFTVVFTFSNRHEPGGKINAKAPVGHERLLAPLREEDVDVRILSKLEFEQSMSEKARAHIVLDEVFSPYTHLSALEGAATGTCVLTNYDEYTRNDLCEYLGAPVESYPFVRVTQKNVVDKIRELRDNPEEAERIGRESRAWMEEFYHHEKLLNRYLQFYD